MSTKKHRTDEELRLIALKYDNKTDFFQWDNPAFQAAKRRKILDRICSHMTKKKRPVGCKTPNYYWTDEMLAQEALKYKDKTEFIQNSWGAYQAARERDILDKICSHMPKRKHVPREKHSKFKWTFDKIQEEALKYDGRDEFKEDSPGAWSAARQLGILDTVCAHMVSGRNSSKAELLLLDIVRNIYPNTKKMVDNKVKIKGKPYIHGFEIDIFVPELNIGIEYDGHYHHSFNGLKRARPNWPDEALHQYHEIKDTWFATKGIKILHITGKNWKKNKQTYINQCLAFLESNKCSN